MRQQPILILQLDERVARSLSESLSEHFGLTQVVTSLDDALSLMEQSPSSVLIADLEAASLAEVSNLKAQFPESLVVCNHRTPDDFMWVRAMNAGADDCCASTDVAGIVRAISAGTRLCATAA